MGTREEIKMMLAKEAMTITKMVELLDEKKGRKIKRNTLSDKLRKDTIRFCEVRDIMDVLGYDIEFKKRN